MNLFDESTETAERDLQLSLTGDRDAYGRVVTRYQSLVCGLALAGCGDVTRSEDLAQEAFVAAWKQLPQLREPSRFKSWVCGIVRQLAASARRQARRDPLAPTELPSDPAVLGSTGPSPADLAAEGDEARLVWKVLDGLPDAYREPLVLYYREGESVARVAEALELSEDAIKQRLARGRALLRGRLAELLGDVLVRSAPGPSFSCGVLAMLPVVMPAATTAAVAATAKAGQTLPAALATVPWWVLLGPALGFLGAWIGYRASVRSAESPAERQWLRRAFWVHVFVTLVFLGVVLVLSWGWKRWLGWTPVQFAMALAALITLFCVGLTLGGLLLERSRRRLVLRERARGTAASAPGIHSGWRYQSRQRWLGLPLIDVRTGRDREGKVSISRGWIAIGDVACGVLFAGGGVAVGGVAFGGVALGGLTLSGLGIGIVALAGMAGGVWAVGGIALGVHAFGGAAVAWTASMGGLALAGEWALGGLAKAAHANDAVARAYFESSRFFAGAQSAMRWMPLFSALAFLPFLWRGRKVRNGGADSARS